MKGRHAIEDYAHRHGLELAASNDGAALTLRLPSNARLRMSRIGAGATLLEGRVCTLPAGRQRREAAVDQLLRAAAARMKTDGGDAALGVEGQRVVLRAVLSNAIYDRELDRAVSEFARSLGLWKKLAVSV